MMKQSNGLLPADIDERDLIWTSTQNCVNSTAAVDFAAQSAVQQCNPFHNEPVAQTPQKASHPVKCLDVLMRRDISIYLGEM